MEGLIELKRLTVINIVDNETDALSSPCSCMTPTPNISKSTPTNTGTSTGTGTAAPDNRPCTYTQELVTVLSDHKILNFDYMCHAAHGLSLLLIAEYDEEENETETVQEVTKSNDNDTSTYAYASVQNASSTVPVPKKRRKSTQLLFDGGPDPAVWRSNAQKLKIDLPSIDTVVLSHYHVDHSNGLRAAVKDISAARIQSGHPDPLVVDLHKSKITTRGLKVRGKIYAMKPDNPTIEELGGTMIHTTLNGKGHLVGNGCFYVSGEIPRKTSFELGIPGHFTGLEDGNWVPDEDVMDERYVACKIRGRGIVVFSACSHAGIVNVCNDAVEKLSSNLTGVVGGFHLAGSSVDNRIDSTISGLKELEPEILLAGHCTGWRAKAKLYQAFEYNFQPLTVGGKYVFNSM